MWAIDWYDLFNFLSNEKFVMPTFSKPILLALCWGFPPFSHWNGGFSLVLLTLPLWAFCSTVLQLNPIQHFPCLLYIKWIYNLHITYTHSHRPTWYLSTSNVLKKWRDLQVHRKVTQTSNTNCGKTPKIMLTKLHTYVEFFVVFFCRKDLE